MSIVIILLCFFFFSATTVTHDSRRRFDYVISGSVIARDNTCDRDGRSFGTDASDRVEGRKPSTSTTTTTSPNVFVGSPRRRTGRLPNVYFRGHRNEKKIRKHTQTRIRT